MVIKLSYLDTAPKESSPVEIGSKANGLNLELLDRDHSILAFNERVLSWAYRDEVPLLPFATRRSKRPRPKDTGGR